MFFFRYRPLFLRIRCVSVRSTNVYEERSLGVFDDEDSEDEPDTEGSRVAVWGRYLAWHARTQLAFGKLYLMWRQNFFPFGI